MEEQWDCQARKVQTDSTLRKISFYIRGGGGCDGRG